MQKSMVGFIAALAIAVASLASIPVFAGPLIRLSIATGTTGGVFFPVGGGLASIISKNLPGVTATAEVTPGSVDNMRLIQAKRADLALVNADAAFDALKGEDVFKGTPVPIRSLAPLYNGYGQLVTIEGTGISTLGDLRGKRVSTGAPGSGTELMALRILEAGGLHPDRDIRRERLAPAPSTDALKDRRMDAYFWAGGVPTGTVIELAVSPGIRIRLVPLDGVVPALQRRWPGVYFRSLIVKENYPGLPADVASFGLAVLLVVHQDFDAELAYQITRLVFERRAELAQVHKEAANITTLGAAARSPAPYHPGAIRYYRERGVEGF
ncbi:MAG: TAXI family TRAP transporter solute-binding subunit [Candidatus Methylomirabilaceae bacterium]